MRPTTTQIKRMIKSEIPSVEFLLVLLSLDKEIYLADLIEKTNISRRAIEKMLNAKGDLIQRRFNYESPDGNSGSPRMITVIRTEKADAILDDIFG